jgi:dTDP-4-dehydrorhamnose reductase
VAKKLLITGGSGDLGRVLCQRAVASGYEVVATYLHRPGRIAAGAPRQLDLNNRDEVQAVLDETEPEAIIHTAVPPLIAHNLRQQIVTGAYHLSKLTPRGTRLIFISTDMVFDGTKAPYRDDDPPSPLSAYGQAKAEMEMMADTVVRTSLVYDFAPGNKQVDWMLERIQRKEKLKLFADELRNAIWVNNLAEVLVELVGGIFTGVLNVAGPKAITRLELGWELLKVLGHDPEKAIEVASGLNTGRPADLTLDVSKAALLLKTPLLSLDEALAAWRANEAKTTH